MWEAIVRVLKRSPLNLVHLLASLFRGRAHFKKSVASKWVFDPSSIPYQEQFTAYLREEKQSGRRLVLATASHRSTAEAIAEHCGLFDLVIATDAATNLKGRNKLSAIRTLVGDHFVYAGDSAADLPIWEAADAAVLVNVRPSLTDRVKAETPIEVEFRDAQPGIRTWTRALRLHQWLKNLLIFVPLLTTFSFQSSHELQAAFLAFFSFSLVASATYLFNDLWDLDSDRAHPRKRLRPLASAQVSIISAILAALGLLLLGFLIAFSISASFALMLTLYMTVTVSYSWMLKRYVLIDVIVLSILFTLRILAGSVAIQVPVTTWLLAFSIFVFLSLALVKRCSELVSLSASQATAASGRDYQVSDLVVLWPLGASAAMAAVVVFGLFINAPDTVSRYASPQFLWLAAIALIYWLSRLWLKTARGEMHDDPIIYTMKDRASIVVISAMVLVAVTARFVDSSAWFR
jgi:4-hydroxybenzoate polyprenyltransferase